MLIQPTTQTMGAKIIICGVGGAGNNAINSMIESGEIQGVKFIAINTDAQVLERSLADSVLGIGHDATRGLGGGGNPEIGKKAAEDSAEYINEAVAGSDMVFVTAGMGGATGTGASPVIAGIAKQLGALTVGVVTKPFDFEGTRKRDLANQGLEDLKAKVDALIVIPNQKILQLVDRNISFKQAMKKSDEVLLNAIKSISDIITITGEMNVDFADVKAIMKGAGTALMGMGMSGNKETRAVEAAKMAINSPLLDYSIDGAKGVLISIRGSSSLSLTEIGDAVELIKQYVSEDANIKFGVHIDESLDENIMINVLATGFDIDPIDAEIKARKNEKPERPMNFDTSFNSTPQNTQKSTQATINRMSQNSFNTNHSNHSTPQNQAPRPPKTEDEFFDEIEKEPAWKRKLKQNSFSTPNNNQNSNQEDDYDITPPFVRRRQQ